MPVSERISGKVAEIMDRYTLAVNKGSDDGVRVGMILSVMGLGGDIVDPDSGVSLGPKPVEKLRVKVTDVYPKFSVAETYRIVTPQSFTDLFNKLGGGTTIFEDTMGGIGVPRGPERERMAGQPKPDETNPKGPVARVRVGDTVRQIFT